MSEKTFDPTRYLRKLGGGDYLEVKWRLLWLRTEHPDAVVETDLVRLDADPPMAVFRARVSIPGGGSATGWGQEELKDFADYLEKAETKALGRALAALGYGTQFCEDFDFAGGDHSRVVDAPVDLSTTRAGGEVNGRTRGQASVLTLGDDGHAASRPENRPALPATEPQIKAIYAIARGAQAMDDAEVEARCRERYGVPPAELNRRQASEFIDVLKSGAAPAH